MFKPLPIHGGALWELDEMALESTAPGLAGGCGRLAEQSLAVMLGRQPLPGTSAIPQERARFEGLPGLLPGGRL